MQLGTGPVEAGLAAWGGRAGKSDGQSPPSRPLISLHSSWGWESSVWREGGSPPEGARSTPSWGWAHLGSHSSRPAGFPLGTWLPPWST